MIKFNNSLAPDFKNFQYLNEASSLDTLGIPKGMVAAIHQKEEHWAKYNRRGHMYRGGTAKGIEYKYFRPSHDVKIEDPIILTGRKSNTSPYSGKTIKSQYTDFSWFLDSLEAVTSIEGDYDKSEEENYGRRVVHRPLGRQMRILFVNKENGLYMYLYNKAKSKGASGAQYAIINWDPVAKVAVDHGFSELTTRGVDRSQIRKAHGQFNSDGELVTGKGGNTNAKVQEYIKSATQVSGRREYAPSPNFTLEVHRISVDETGITEPRETSAGRESKSLLSGDVLRLFAKQYANILPKIKPEQLDPLKVKIESMRSYSSKEQPEEITELAKALGLNDENGTAAANLYLYLYNTFRNFRSEIYEEGRSRLEDSASSYPKSAGFDLQAENDWADTFLGRSRAARYSYNSKTFSPDEEGKTQDEIDAMNASDDREAQPEKIKRSLPTAGEYASIKGIVNKHTTDGMFGKFAWFLLTDKIKFADASLASMMGISVESDVDDNTEEDSWLY